jgi:hypothetical protein
MPSRNRKRTIPRSRQRIQKEVLIMRSISLPRLALFLGGLAAIVAAYALQTKFPTDAVEAVPEPSVAAMLAIGGVAAVAASLLGGCKK